MAEIDHATFAQQNVARHLERARSSREARFAAPEALATAVGAGFILGPVGGLLLGAAQGILGKRMEQSQLDAIAAEQSAYDDVDARARETIERALASATNPQDVEQLATMATQQAAARRMLASPIPQIQQQGAALQSQIFAEQRAYAVRQEEQAIAAHAQEEAGRLAMGDRNYSRYTNSRDNFMKESAPYLEVRNATVNLMGALDRGTAVDQYAAVKMLEKALDPASIVRPEEQEAWGNLGSALDRAGTFVERLRSGKSLSPEQIRDIRTLALGIERQSYEMQAEREARYLDEITDIGLPDRFHDNFRLARPLEFQPQPAPVGEQVPSSSPGVAQAAIAAGLVGADLADAIPSEVKTGAAAAGGLTAARWMPTVTKLAA